MFLTCALIASDNISEIVKLHSVNAESFVNTHVVSVEIQAKRLLFSKCAIPNFKPAKILQTLHK